MKKTKLLILLSQFSAYEMNKLRKFIISPYFNRSKKLILFFDFLKKDLLKNKLKEKEFYYDAIYPQELYNDQKYRNLHSDLFSLVLKFLSQEEYEKDFQGQANNLIQSVKERDVKEVFEKAISTAYKWIDKVTYQDGNHFLQNFNLEKNIYNLTSEFEKKTKIKKTSREISVLKINDNLDYFYMIEKLKYYNSYLSSKRIINVDYEFPYIDRVLAIVKTHKAALPPALQIYFEMYKTSINPNDTKSYKNLKSLIRHYSFIFNHSDKKSIYESLINFSVMQVNKGNSEFYEELLDVYMNGIKSGALIENQYLSPTSFRNIVTLALRMKKIDWTKNFIHENIILINEEFRNNALKYNLSRVYFYKKEHKKVIETVSEVEFKDPLYAYMSKSMLLVSYYELYNEETLMYFLDSFATFMRRSKGSSDKVRKGYLNLIKYMRMLQKARYDKSILPKLKQKIINTDELASRQWFLEKLKDVRLPNEE